MLETVWHQPIKNIFQLINLTILKYLFNEQAMSLCKKDVFWNLFGLDWSVPVPTAQLQAVLIQKNFREFATFTTDLEKIQNQLWIDFCIFLNQSKIQTKNSVFF